MELRTTSSYATALRPGLRSQVFRAVPLRLLWLPIHYAVIALGMVTIHRGWLALPLELLLSLVMGASFAGLTFVAHEALHGAIVRNRLVRRLVGRLGFLPFAVPPRLWEAWHNRVHHGNTNRPGTDPDTYPTLSEYRGSALLRRTTDWLSPGRSRLAGVISLLVGFSVQSSHMLLAARRREFLNRSGYRLALLEAAAAWGLIAALAFTLGVGSFVLAFVLPLVVGNVIIMSFILTNHNLSPQTQINDPLINSLSVSGPRFIEWLTLGFGFHVEHHLFPSVSGRYGRELAGAVRRSWPERYQSLPYFRALLLLHRSPRVYETDTMLIDPTSGRLWPTLVPSRTPSAAPEPLDAVAASKSPSTPSITSALALSITAIACAGPALRTPDAADDAIGQTTEAQPAPESSSKEPFARPAADPADAVDAHRAPPATTAAEPSSPPEPGSTGGAAVDAELVERIRAALRAEPTLSSLEDIDVVSRSGHVSLSGPVRTEAQRTALENVVKTVRGVTHIDSRLVVKGP
jgi:fatty acid desaturase